MSRSDVQINVTEGGGEKEAGGKSGIITLPRGGTSICEGVQDLV